VGKDFEDEDFPGVVVDGCDEAVMVSGDVENDDCLSAGYGYGIGVGECLADFLDASPTAFPGNVMPRGKGSGCIRMELGVFIEAAAGDDSHEVLSVVNLATSRKMSSG